MTGNRRKSGTSLNGLPDRTFSRSRPTFLYGKSAKSGD